MAIIRDRIKLIILLGALCLLFAALLLTMLASPGRGPVAGAATIIYVDKSVLESGDGSSWENAFQNLQDALDAASSGDEIWVARATYYPDEGQSITGGDRTAAFRLRNGIAIYGGFLGGETSLDQRDPWNYITTLSGDIDQDDTTGFFDLVLDPADIAGDNSYHVVVGSTTDSSARLDGFAITAGQANGSPAADQHEGGGIFVETGGPLLNNLLVVGNTADEGGGVATIAGSAVVMSNAVLAANAAADFGGALHNEQSSGTFTNLLISGNVAGSSGGAIYNVASSPELTNLTITANAAGVAVTSNAVQVPATGGGIFNLTGSKPLIQNSIIWNNQDDSGVGSSSASIHNQDAGSTPKADYSDIQGLAGINLLIYDGTSFDQDPLFVAPLDPSAAPAFNGNYRLNGLSPAIDAGDDALNSLPTDLDGGPRILGAAIDLGPYESTPAPDIALHKSSDVPFVQVGDTVNYTYELVNTGGVTVTGLTASDDLLGPIDFGLTELAPGISATANLSYTAVFTDVPGPIVNTASITGTIGVSTTVMASDTLNVSIFFEDQASRFPIVLAGWPPATPTPTPTNTPTSTATPTTTSTPTATATGEPATATPTATNTPSGTTCQNIVGNPGFEAIGSWVLETTAFTASYTTAQQHTGNYSVRTGILNQIDNIFSYSSAMQTVTIPANATSADLSYYIYPQTSETSLFKAPEADELLTIQEADGLAYSDIQLVLVLDTNNNELARLYGQRRNDRVWLLGEHDLIGFRGQTIKLYFGTFNNGQWNQGVTAMFVDDVELEVCTPN